MVFGFGREDVERDRLV